MILAGIQYIFSETLAASISNIPLKYTDKSTDRGPIYCSHYTCVQMWFIYSLITSVYISMPTIGPANIAMRCTGSPIFVGIAVAIAIQSTQTTTVTSSPSICAAVLTVDHRSWLPSWCRTPTNPDGRIEA